MTNGLQDREKAMELKFQHDRELDFKVRARAQKKLALWVGELLGYESTELEIYAQKKLNAFIKTPDDNKVLQEMSAELDQKGHMYTLHQMKKLLEEYVCDVRQELRSS